MVRAADPSDADAIVTHHIYHSRHICARVRASVRACKQPAIAEKEADAQDSRQTAMWAFWTQSMHSIAAGKLHSCASVHADLLC